MNLKKTTQTPSYGAEGPGAGFQGFPGLPQPNPGADFSFPPAKGWAPHCTAKQCSQITFRYGAGVGKPTPWIGDNPRGRAPAPTQPLLNGKRRSGGFGTRSAHTSLNTFNWQAEDHYYRDIICQDFIYKQNYHNIMEFPSIQKLVINSTSKSFTSDIKNITPTLLGLEIICGQKLKTSTAKKSIAGFKIREGHLIGCKVTLRKHCISYFLDKLRLLILPRFGSFTGCNLTSFDKKANISIGLNDLLLFPELEALFELFENLGGIDICFVMCKKKQSENLLLLSALQLPIHTQ